MKNFEDVPDRPNIAASAEPAAGGGANPGGTLRQRKVNRWRLGWFLAALLLLVTGTLWFCWLQPSAPVPLNAESVSWKKWLWYPHERNAAKRLPTVPDSDLKGAFFTNNLGWVVGSGGVILHTRDGGKSWQLQTNIAWPKPLVLPVQHKSTVSSKGVFLPKQEPSPVQMNLPPPAALNVAQKGYEAGNAPAGNAPAVLKQKALNQKMPDAKGDWLPGVPKLPESLQPPWEKADSESPANQGKSLSGICFVDAKTGWAVGEDGVILHTADGGKSWAAASAITNSAVSFVNRQTDWSVGSRGTILHSDDGGKHWNCQTFNAAVFKHGGEQITGNYSRWPAAMFYAVLLLSLVFLRIGLLKQTAPEKFIPSIADFAVSDRPLTSKDFDALNFGPLAQGIANFLRNKSTVGPLTLAVAGPWGSGKSSIMGLLREKLVSQGIRPVWFNAWHHQDETQLLAALLENIRSQAVPPWYSWRGAAFRVQLINRRMHREWPMLFLGALFLASFAALLNLLVRDGLSWDAVKDMVQKPDLLSAGKFAVLLTALATGWKMLQGFQAFGLNPAKLLASVTDKAKLSDLGEQTSFRHRFAQEFEDVTAALQPRTMTVFIDDLDRCEPEQVMQVMQSLNFLSSSGECFLIIGMEENAVTNCVAISLKEQFEIEERRVGKECLRLCRSRWSPYH